MDTENLVIYDDTKRQKVKHVGKVMPDIGVAVLARAFGVEAVGLGDAAGFMVASDQMDSVGVSQFQTNKKGNGLNAEHATVYIVACLSLLVSTECDWLAGFVLADRQQHEWRGKKKR